MADTGDYEIVPYEERYRSEVLRLRTELRAFQGEWNAAEFVWRHEENPYLHEPRITLGLHQGRVVAMRALYGAQWEVGTTGHRFLAPCLGGSVIERRFRSRGLFARLTRALEDELAAQGATFAFNFSAGPATTLGSLALGWRGIGPIFTWRRMPTAWQQSGWTARARRTLARAVARVRSAGSSVSLSETPRGAEMAGLVRDCPWDGRLRHVRDETYIDWRFRNPASHNLFLFLPGDAGLAGYLVLRQPRGGWKLDIVDWQTREPDALASLLAAAINHADSRSMPLCVWPASLPAATQTWLAEHGFLEVTESAPFRGYEPSLLVTRLDGEDDPHPWTLEDVPLDQLAGWDLRMIYSDAF